MDELKACPYTRKEKMAVNNLKIDNGNGAYILKRDADVILHYIKFLQSEVDRLSAEPENKPLTLEQLRQMDGEPVYCVGIKNQGLTGWGLVCTDGHEIIDSYGDFWEFLAYGEEYVAYARKPEQEGK